jgi:geranylgeranyl pyrophosphate synthase
VTSLESSLLARSEIDEYFCRWLESDSHWNPIWKSWAKHLILGAGKALRPALCFDFYSAVSDSPRQRVGDGVLPLGLALELFHTYTLVHDDLPAMDNDDFRRGRPTLHRLTSEANAILMGDALLTASFEVLAKASISAENFRWAVQEFSRNLGAAGLIEGQRRDLESKTANFSELQQTHQLKTGKLFSMACILGVLPVEGRDSLWIDRARRWGENFGFLYQLLDDLLDRSATLQELGKTPMKDFVSGKKTVCDLLTPSELQKLATKNLAELRTLAQPFPNPKPILSWVEGLEIQFAEQLKKL